MNALWCSVIIWGKNFLSLLAKTLEKILYKTLQRLMGWNSETNAGLENFGIRVIKLWLRWVAREAKLKKYHLDLRPLMEPSTLELLGSPNPWNLKIIVYSYHQWPRVEWCSGLHQVDMYLKQWTDAHNNSPYKKNFIWMT